MIEFNWPSLSSNEFEELCTDLMRRKNFFNVERVGGPGSGDRGRDITAEEILTSQTGSTLRSKLLVQCKNYAGSQTTIGTGDIEDWRQRAITLGCNGVFVMTSHDLSAPAKSAAVDTDLGRSRGIYVQWWNKYTLTRELLLHPDLKRQYELEIIAAPTISIGILNGYARNPSSEIPCSHTFSRVPPADWEELLNQDNISSEQITTSQISIAYDAILNPFGEIYPEENPRDYSTYTAILDYIKDGGIFSGSGGFPFYYLWDCNQGREFTTTQTRVQIIDRVTGVMSSFIAFSDVKFTRDFNVNLDSGDSRDINVVQNEADHRFVGDLSEYDQVTQFRSIINQGREHVIPLLRSDDNSLFPLAAIQFGHGYLIHSGFNQNRREAEITATALINWLRTAGGNVELT